jgi:UDP-N-acetylglucosamine 4,6-dehydratase/5-epimerase
MERILITGGSGFLGRELALKLKNNYEVILGSRNNGLNQEAEQYTGCKSIPLDVSNIYSVQDAFNFCEPDIVIHAGATKYVNISEEQPLECIDVNVLGSQNIARVAIQKGVKTVIGISTDKAAPPVPHIYGSSKALMERMFCSLDFSNKTNFSCVRFGNIAWSTGSVFPLWKRMMEDNGLIESTGPNMKRFFFSVSDAADLVIRNLDNIHTTRGKVLSMKMKASKILNLLNAWQKLYGTKWIEIDRRLGESDHESMIGSIELKYTAEIILDERDHFLTSFRDPLTEHAQDVFTTEFAEHHSEEEMIDLIKLGTLS